MLGYLKLLSSQCILYIIGVTLLSVCNIVLSAHEIINLKRLLSFGRYCLQFKSL